MGEKEKLLVTSNFSFSHNVFYPIWHLFFYFKCTLKCCLQFLSIWTSLKFCHLVMVNFKSFLHIYSFQQMRIFTIFHNVFYAICILKSLNSQISVVVCSFFEFGTISKLCIKECPLFFSVVMWEAANNLKRICAKHW